MAEQMCRFAIADLTLLTGLGYVGEDEEHSLEDHQAVIRRQQAKYGIIILMS